MSNVVLKEIAETTESMLREVETYMARSGGGGRSGGGRSGGISRPGGGGSAEA
jgi:hypothetical protein